MASFDSPCHVEYSRHHQNSSFRRGVAREAMPAIFGSGGSQTRPIAPKLLSSVAPRGTTPFDARVLPHFSLVASENAENSRYSSLFSAIISS